MKTSERLPRIAATVAFVMAGLVVLNGILGPIVALPLALVPLWAGIGILRNRIWSAYGFATFLFAQVLLLPLILLRPGSSNGRAAQIVGMALFSAALGMLFLLAGRSMAALGARRGRAWPWIVVAALRVVPFFFLQTFEIPSGSMENALLPLDSIVAEEFPLRPPARGQLVVFILPADREQILAKRVIAIPGDHFRIAENVVILNGTALDEKYVTHDARPVAFFPENLPNDADLPGCAEGHEMLSRQVVNGEIVVPADNYFVLGDNRENSLDSRCWGFVSSSDLIGKPLMIYDSVDRSDYQPSHPTRNLLGHRRWARMFTVF